jgi:hypothetical protein
MSIQWVRRLRRLDLSAEVPSGSQLKPTKTMRSRHGAECYCCAYGAPTGTIGLAGWAGPVDCPPCGAGVSPPGTAAVAPGVGRPPGITIGLDSPPGIDVDVDSVAPLPPTAQVF